jgi:hypothetical protein
MVIRISSVVLSVAGVLALISGVLFWTGAALNLVSMHMLLGFLSVAALWIVAVGQALTKGGSWITCAAAIVIGALTTYVGIYQKSLMVGPMHWIIQVLHLALGILTIGLGHMAASRYRKTPR